MSLIDKIFGTVETSPVDPATEGKLGTDHVRAILEGLLLVALGLEEASEDGIGISDVALVGPIVKAAGSLRYYREARAELADLLPAEASALADRVALRLGSLDNVKVSRVATRVTDLVPPFLELLDSIRDLRNPDFDIKRAEVLPED